MGACDQRGMRVTGGVAHQTFQSKNSEKGAIIAALWIKR
jgi:hypothetical protein